VFVPDELVVSREDDGAGLTMVVLASPRPPVGAIATDGSTAGAWSRSTTAVAAPAVRLLKSDQRKPWSQPT
jgi:hypothetical protein